MGSQKASSFSTAIGVRWSKAVNCFLLRAIKAIRYSAGRALFVWQEAMNVERPRDVVEWFESVPHLLSQQEWEVCERVGQSSLSHCRCPWGGHLLRLALSGIQVQDADTKSLLLRPETRAKHEPQLPLGGRMELIEQLAPGGGLRKQGTPHIDPKR